MEPTKSRILGMAMSAAGAATIVLAVLLFGVTKEGGGPDWVSIITAIAGFVMAATGLYTLFRNKGPASGGHTPHAAS